MQTFTQPLLVLFAAPRLRDTELIFPEHDDWNCDKILPSKRFPYSGLIIDDSRQRVGVENQAHSSGSIFSNSSSIIC